MQRFAPVAAALLLAAALPARAQVAAQCSPAQKTVLDNARNERSAGQYDKALADAGSVGPQSIRGQYTIGLIKMDQGAAQKDAAKRDQLRKDGMAILEIVAQKTQQAADGKDATLIACLKDQQVFSIMNSLAAYYLAQGNSSKAELYLKKSSALGDRKLLDVDTQRKTFGNLGSLYFSTGSYDASNSNLSRAIALGNPNPALPKMQAAIKVIKAPAH